jgi:hypothetical protein
LKTSGGSGWSAQGDEFGGYGSDRVEILAGIGVGASELFRVYVAEGAEDSAVPAHSGFVEETGDAEVGEADAGGVQEQVGRLEVAVNDARGMHHRQPMQQLVDEPQQGGRVVLPKHLRRDVRLPPQVPGSPDRTHPARADQIDQHLPPSKRLHRPEAP